jgi:hypothetical protein
MHRIILFAMSALAICLSATTGVQAAETLGTLAFTDTGTTEAGTNAQNLSPTGDINTATQFFVEDLVSTTSNSGVFVGMPPQSLGHFLFSLTSPTIAGFPANEVFGSFRLESLTEPVNDTATGFAVLLASGVWVPGSWAMDHFGVPDKPFDADLRMAFTQTPAHTGSISASGTFAVPVPATVPEPSSIVLVLTGLAAGVVTDWRRRQRQSAVA